MPHWAPPYSRKVCCNTAKRSSEANPSIVTTLLPLAWSAGMRQLLTKVPSIKPEQEPHSPSPQPSFVPVNPRSCRNTSSRRSIVYALTVTDLPLSVKPISHFPFSEDSLIVVLVPMGAPSSVLPVRPTHRKYPLEVTVSNRTERAAHLRAR